MRKAIIAVPAHFKTKQILVSAFKRVINALKKDSMIVLRNIHKLDI